jgi:hypothetical protein
MHHRFINYVSDCINNQRDIIRKANAGRGQETEWEIPDEMAAGSGVVFVGGWTSGSFA